MFVNPTAGVKSGSEKGLTGRKCSCKLGDKKTFKLGMRLGSGMHNKIVMGGGSLIRI